MKNKINKTSNSSISLVSEDMLRTSSSCKPKKVRHKGGISSWCKRLRKVTDVYRYWEWNICPRRYPTWTRSTISARSRRMSIIDVFVVNLICTECTGTCIPNYHTITTTKDPHIVMKTRATQTGLCNQGDIINDTVSSTCDIYKCFTYI